jgi:hypothetical protein
MIIGCLSFMNRLRFSNQRLKPDACFDLKPSYNKQIEWDKLGDIKLRDYQRHHKV